MTLSPAYLMDASAFIHRAFHALSSFTGPKGQPTGAIFGYVNSLLSLIKDKRPEYLAVVFDSRGPGRRHEIYPKYKENRPPMDPSLVLQMGPIREITAALGLFSLEERGFEADDLIAALARRFEENGQSSVIVSGDKDFYQLLSGRISMYDPSPKKQSAMTAEEFTAKFNIAPPAFLEAQALMGDSTDNIPGVPKIGQVTALNLIREFGTVENLYQNLNRVKSKSIKETLKNHKDEAFLSLELARLGAGDPPTVDPSALIPAPPNLPRLFELFNEQGFERLKREVKKLFETEDIFAGISAQNGSFFATQKASLELSEAEAAPKAEAGEDSFRFQLATEENKSVFLEKVENAGIVAIKTALRPESPASASIIGLALALEENEAYYLPFSHKGEDAAKNAPFELWRKDLTALFGDSKVKLVAYDAKREWLALARHGLFPPAPKDDPSLAAYLLDPDRKQSLDFLSQTFLDGPFSALKTPSGGDTAAIDKLPPDLAGQRLAYEARKTLQLAGVLREKLERETRLLAIYEKIELPLTELLARMELLGVLIDGAALNAIGETLGRDVALKEKKIQELAGEPFNVASPKQLAEILFRRLGLPEGKKTAKKTGFSTDSEVLRSLYHLHPIIGEILGFRESAKLKTYADKLPVARDEQGRVHTTYNQALTGTGRLSSSNPNLQNIPARSEEGRQIRACFVADSGCLLTKADYSQIELRIMAHFSQDEALLKAFKNDEDIHAQTAARIFGVKPEEIGPELRRRAKTINFGVIYGQGAYGLAQKLEIPNSSAKILIADYFSRFPGVKRYTEEIQAKAKKTGQVETWYGRIRRLDKIASLSPMERREAERVAVNAPIQGTAADLIKMAMLMADRKLTEKGLKARLILQVHDELVAEAPKEESEEVGRILAEAMLEAGVHPLVDPPDGRGPIEVPLKADVATGPNWAMD
jgi:DNA polymerase-1